MSNVGVSPLYIYIHIIYIYIYIYVIYIPWLRGIYGEYKTRAPRYWPEAKPRANMEVRGSYIHHIYREAMVHIHVIYSIANRNIKEEQDNGHE